MYKRHIGVTYIIAFCFALPGTAQPMHCEKSTNALARSLRHIEYDITAQANFSNHDSPLWLNANKYGMSSINGEYGFLRIGIKKDIKSDSIHNWKIGFGLDVATGYNMLSTFTVQQCYADFGYKNVSLSVGCKERPMAFKNQYLSSGGQTFGINAKPVPGIYIEVPEYRSITGKSNWAAIKGHFGYGVMTDGKWQKNYVAEGMHYVQRALYHSKAGYLRIGNKERFPLYFEGGLEMACQFGGTVYNPTGRNGYYGKKLEMGHSLKDFVKAIFGGGNDATDDVYHNAAGNTLGSWLVSLAYETKKWGIRCYYDHFFEDHSQMFWEYGWLDGMIGTEITLPKNPFVSKIVYEYLNTTYQSGPINHDHTGNIKDQISARDNYYNHNLYQGWQHWGQAIGNPLFHSPLYNHDGSLVFTGNRFNAHHVGIMGRPAKGLNYRLLYSYMENWGTYYLPYTDKKYSTSMLLEIGYDLSKMGRFNAEGWSLKAGLGLDRGNKLMNNSGMQFTITKRGLLTK